MVSRKHRRSFNTFTCQCLVRSCVSCCLLFAFQEVNVTTSVPTRCVCLSRLCVMVSLTAKTAAMSSTAPEHVSAYDVTVMV